MQDLIRALTILSKYTAEKWPTHCEHDVMYVMVDPANVTAEDVAELERLGFEADRDEDHFYSFRFGSC